MNNFSNIYSDAISHTKQKVHDDLFAYLGNKDHMPLFKEYVKHRELYIQQIWLNVWLNKASNELTSKEKRTFLREKGFVTKDVAKKLINQLFRNEIRSYGPFDTMQWLNEKYGALSADSWRDLYEKARSCFLAEQDQKRQEKEKQAVHDLIETETEKLLGEKKELLYLSFRQAMAVRLEKDLQEQTRFYPIDPAALEEQLIEDGTFDAKDYETAGDFFTELTGGIEKSWNWEFEYETYHSLYEQHAAECVFDLALEEILSSLPDRLKEQYQQAYGEFLAADSLYDLVDHLLSGMVWEFFEELNEELVDHLLVIASMPHDEAVQQELYDQQRAEREQKKEKRLAEIKRRQDEEERQIEEIFGQAYHPPSERNVHYILHIGETNTGKTHRALQRMKKAESGLYLAPLRLLALEVYEKLNKEGIMCSLKTGEEEKVQPNARHASCTVEMFHEKDLYDVVVIDEAQMIADKDRGFSWYKAITGARAAEVHIIASRNMKNMLIQLLGDNEYELHEYSRDIPLKVEPAPFKLTDTAKGDALVCFSRKEVLETAAKLRRNRFSVSMIYGSMPPETRKKQMQQFIEGKTSVIVSTDAIGMGLNLPIQRIVFLKNEKFDGTRRRLLTSQEVKQIAGRAGRKGIYPVGKVAFTSDVKKMTYLLEKEDEPVRTFAIAPTAAVFERFQRYYRDLGIFFELWHRFKSPKGTKKAALSQERYLYEIIQGSEIEARMPMIDLYGFLHLPFSTKEPGMTKQWVATMQALVNGMDLPEPIVKRGNLEDLELSYKAIGLHLLFLYRLGRQTEAIYWERLRHMISDEVHKHLQSGETGKGKTCRMCGKKLPSHFRYQICDDCHVSKQKKKYGRKKKFS
ncbi:RNA helicase [Bacillus wudalianchiensis]|uniref:RNA helicase n=2 Tax=Pseudobacillus wudalianchiensis TaxID=1743143 RepID=A0A1B9AMC8_9BACI|nr:helicase-related protein [Bacillus wudalianchiensis]OCA85022.1 RNA helicase [Bacillus wudalianchiensis]